MVIWYYSAGVIKWTTPQLSNRLADSSKAHTPLAYVRANYTWQIEQRIMGLLAVSAIFLACSMFWTLTYLSSLRLSEKRLAQSERCKIYKSGWRLERTKSQLEFISLSLTDMPPDHFLYFLMCLLLKPFTDIKLLSLLWIIIIILKIQLKRSDDPYIRFFKLRSLGGFSKALCFQIPH
jgi:hypothetical protein